MRGALPHTIVSKRKEERQSNTTRATANAMARLGVVTASSYGAVQRHNFDGRVGDNGSAGTSTIGGINGDGKGLRASDGNESNSDGNESNSALIWNRQVPRQHKKNIQSPSSTLQPLPPLFLPPRAQYNRLDPLLSVLLEQVPRSSVVDLLLLQLLTPLRRRVSCQWTNLVEQQELEVPRRHRRNHSLVHFQSKDLEEVLQAGILAAMKLPTGPKCIPRSWSLSRQQPMQEICGPIMKTRTIEMP